MKILFPLLLVAFILGSLLVSAEGSSYRRVSMADAVGIMNTNTNYIILDVRTPAEYASGHIPGAINLPLQDIAIGYTDPLPDLNQLILVYCRSGNRSLQASAMLAEYGYNNIVEFGGIHHWSGDIAAGAV